MEALPFRFLAVRLGQLVQDEVLLLLQRRLYLVGRPSRTLSKCVSAGGKTDSGHDPWHPPSIGKMSQQRDANK